MMNMVLSYQCCMPMNRGSLCPLPTLKSCTKKTNNLCFSTPLLLGQKMPSITKSSSLLASPHPLMMIQPDQKDEDGRSLCRFYDYVNKKDVNMNIKIPEEVDDAICVGSSHGWLAYISRLDCSVFLWNPLTTSPLIYLPPIHILPSITVMPREELYEEEPVYEFGGHTVYNKCKSAYESYDDDFGRSSYTRSQKRLSLYFIGKIILSSVPTSDDCIVLAMPRPSIQGRVHSIAFCKPGDKSWTFVEPPHKNYVPIVDVIHFEDQLFYAISSCGRTLYAYDLSDLSSPESYVVKPYFKFEPISLLEEYKRKWCEGRHYLVESLGDLLWVRRLIYNNITMNGNCKFLLCNGVESPTETVKFVVYRLNFSRNRWECTECIGDQVLFLGTNQSISLSTRDFPSLKANCIYFADDSAEIHKKSLPYRGLDYGHYKLGRSGYEELCKFGDVEVLPLPFWVMRHFR